MVTPAHQYPNQNIWRWSAMLAFSARHFHCFQMCMFVLFLLTRLFAITFIVLFLQGLTPTCLSTPFLYSQGRRRELTSLHVCYLSYLVSLEWERGLTTSLHLFIHPAVCVVQWECPVPCNYESHICATLCGSACSSCYNLSVSCWTWLLHSK